MVDMRNCFEDIMELFEQYVKAKKIEMFISIYAMGLMIEKHNADRENRPIDMEKLMQNAERLIHYIFQKKEWRF